MIPFINPDFMLTKDSARELYHTFAEHQPIIDYHCHLMPSMIADNHQFSSISEAWLGGDHYKWRAMRGNGINEHYITGAATDYEKFEKWAATLPYAMRNPLYHWTQLELKQIFGIDAILKPETAREIYDECNSKLALQDFRAQGLMKRFNVEAVCTTDDPIDSLEHHQRISQSDFSIKVLPTWRADKAMDVEDPQSYNEYLDKLEAAAGINIENYGELIDALRIRQDYFAANGCKLSDHGLETFYSESYSDYEIKNIFQKIRTGNILNNLEVEKIKSAVLYDLAVMDAEKGWVQQFHIGAIRNNNSRMFRALGADTGYDAIHDLHCAAAGHRLFDRLESSGKLAKTILYNLNPKDNEVLATMAYTFNDGNVAGKMQLGTGWWFLDQEDGIRKQINALSTLGLLSRFVGMLTDSRSFLSYPRHDYFRRILCDIIGSDIESGRLPRSEMSFFGSIVEDICYNNIKNYIWGN